MEQTGGMGDKTVLITGGTSGIGKATAVALAAMGARVVVTGRNPERGRAAVEEIRKDSGNESVELMLADLSVQAEVRRLADEFLERHDRLDVLINNAGVVVTKRTETPDGLETTFATNHLAPFLLTNLLLEKLKESAPSRIVTVSSEAQRWGKVNFDDLQSKRRYGGMSVYGMSKLANAMFTRSLASRLSGTSVTANCMHPGAVNTNLGQSNKSPLKLLAWALKPFMRSPEQGADTLIWLSSVREVEGISGKYFSNRKEISPSKPADDPTALERLWDESANLTNLQVTA